MPSFGLIGYPLEHSYSAAYFNKKFQREKLNDHQYHLFPIESIHEIRPLIENNKDLRGLNVTIPYKEQVLDYLDEAGGIVTATGAANCIRIERTANDLVMKGFNTDVYGFEHALLPHLSPQHQRALILGTGGSSKAVAYVLQKLHIGFIKVSRNPRGKDQTGYDSLDKDMVDKHLLIINTTPLGMFPDIQSCPEIPYQHLNAGHLLFDLVYNPAETVFLKKGKKQGAVTMNGLEMLRLQAERSWKIWHEERREKSC